MVCFGAISKTTVWFKDRNIKDITDDGMLKSMWQTTGCEQQFLPGPLCVQPEMLILLSYEPLEGSCVIKSCTVFMVVDSGARRC